MSYRADGDSRVARVETAIEELVAALRATGDPVFCTVNPAALRWCNEALGPLGLEVRASAKLSDHEELWKRMHRTP